ncbi:hypothetical protein [Microbacterium sp. JZ31]|uniref:hypothetical protein n=1 Tax=Microbacterium sp. JZ31 TaxID=1906274 RepID=UPI0019319903|nr:hypothetical protein [Microbacterium sp. JZ31]
MIAVRIATDLWRIVAHRWMELLAWWIAGVLIRDLVLHAAAEVAGFSPFLAVFVLALAMLARLVVFVAMLLVVRDELDGLVDPHLPGVAEFMRAVLGAAGPFAIFYYVSGLLEQDWRSYLELAAAAHQAAWGGDPPELWVIGLNVPTVIVIVVCLALRVAWGRSQERLLWWIGGAAVLLEVLWVFFTEYAFDDALGRAGEWLQGRQLGVWIDDARAALAEIAAPLVALWDAIGPLTTVLFEALFVPIAWMLAAATVYGRSLDEQARPASAGRRVGETVVGEVVDQTDTLRSALRLMRRTGPVVLAAYCLVYALIGAVEPLVLWIVSRLVGPHDTSSVLHAFVPQMALLPTLVVTPLLIALVAAACNLAVGHLSARPGASAAGSGDGEAQPVASGVGDDIDRDEQLVGDVARDEEHAPQLGRA